jgi:hypothetical protein
MGKGQKSSEQPGRLQVRWDAGCPRQWVEGERLGHIGRIKGDGIGHAAWRHPIENGLHQITGDR